jgi:hypothetical protein
MRYDSVSPLVPARVGVTVLTDKESLGYPAGGSTGPADTGETLCFRTNEVKMRASRPLRKRFKSYVNWTKEKK